MHFRLMTLGPSLALCAALALSVSVVSAVPAPRRAAARQTAKSPDARAMPVRPAGQPSARPAVLPAPWPPVPDVVGAPIMPTEYPNVFVRFAPAPPRAPGGDASIYLVPGARASGQVPKTVQTPFVPIVGRTPGGVYYMEQDPGRMDYLTATSTADGRVAVRCGDRAEPAPTRQGGAK